MVPPVSLKLDLEAPLEPRADQKGADLKLPYVDGKAGASGRAPHPSRPWERQSASAGRRGGPSGPPKTGSSWWTARATAGEVKAGFTKEEILRKPEADPRAEGGMFARLEGLLRALSR